MFHRSEFISARERIPLLLLDFGILTSVFQWQVHGNENSSGLLSPISSSAACSIQRRVAYLPIWPRPSPLDYYMIEQRLQLDSHIA